MKRFAVACLVLLLCVVVVPISHTQEVEPQPEIPGEISFEPNVIPSTKVYARVGRNNESFQFAWLNNTFDIELFFNATWRPQKLYSLNDFITDVRENRSCEMADVNFTTQRMGNRIQFGWNITGVENVSDSVYEAWFKIEDTQPFDYDDIELEEIEVLEAEEPHNITRFHLPDNLVLSFEDLRHKGFIIGYQNKTTTSVKGFSGKSSWNLDPITYSSNIITVTGGTEGSPNDFDDIYTADTSGSRELMANASATADMSLATQVQPADDEALKLTLEISGYVSEGYVNVTGTDKDGNAQTETNIHVTADGNLTTSKWFATVSANGIDCNGSYGIRVCQERWGVVWKEDNNFLFDCEIYVGDGVVETWFADINKQVLQKATGSTGVTGQFIRVQDNAHFRVGVLVDVAKKIGRSGCYIGSLVTATTYFWLIGFQPNAVGELYSSSFYTATGTRSYIGASFATQPTTAIKLYECSLDGVCLSGKWDTYRTEIKRGDYGLNYQAGGTFEDILIHSKTRIFWFYQWLGATTFRNITARQYTALIFVQAGLMAHRYFINPDVENWTILWGGGISTHNIYRQYEFDLTFTFENGSYTEGTNVTISNDYLGTSDSWILSSNGSIPQQTYSTGHYNRTGGDTIYDYNPYNITATLDGYRTYTQLINITKPEDLTISLTEPSHTASWHLASIVVFLLILIPAITILWVKKH